MQFQRSICSITFYVYASISFAASTFSLAVIYAIREWRIRHSASIWRISTIFFARLTKRLCEAVLFSAAKKLIFLLALHNFFYFLQACLALSVIPIIPISLYSVYHGSVLALLQALNESELVSVLKNRFYDGAGMIALVAKWGAEGIFSYMPQSPYCGAHAFMDFLANFYQTLNQINDHQMSWRSYNNSDAINACWDALQYFITAFIVVFYMSYTPACYTQYNHTASKNGVLSTCLPKYFHSGPYTQSKEIKRKAGYIRMAIRKNGAAGRRCSGLEKSRKGVLESSIEFYNDCLGEKHIANTQVNADQ